MRGEEEERGLIWTEGASMRSMCVRRVSKWGRHWWVEMVLVYAGAVTVGCPNRAGSLQMVAGADIACSELEMDSNDVRM